MAKQHATLVTGGAGYIDSHTVLALHEAGRSVVVLDNLSTGCREVVPDNVTIVEGDAEQSPILVADAGDLRRTLDWTPRFDDLEAIIATAVKWEKSILRKSEDEPSRGYA